MNKKISTELTRKRITFLLVFFIFFTLFVLAGNKVLGKRPEERVIYYEILEFPEDEKITEVSAFPEEVLGINVHTELIEEGTEARPGTKRKIRYIVIHETDNIAKGAGAQNHAKFLNENNTSATSWHYTIDDTEIYHHIPDNEIAHHAANEKGNQYGIGVELCVNKDGNFEKTFDNAAKLVAYLLNQYDLSVGNIRTHHDFSGKDCPHRILQNNRINEFKRKVLSYQKMV